MNAFQLMGNAKQIRNCWKLKLKKIKKSCNKTNISIEHRTFIEPQVDTKEVRLSSVHPSVRSLLQNVTFEPVHAMQRERLVDQNMQLD